MKKIPASLFALILCSALSVALAADKAAKVTGSYEGGGIRGAVATVPEGWLVSPAEALAYQGLQGFEEPPMLRAKAVAPVIDILKPQPNADLKVKAPFAIEVQFKSQPDAGIVPSSFRVFYGALKIDITNRITKYVKVSEQGFNLENAQIPVGKHRLTLQVQDDKQRLAERELRFEVE
jgi:hypothetical protein